MEKTTKTTKNHVKEIIFTLNDIYPNSKTSLDFNNPFELLIATVLSAQTTDKAVNNLTPNLFENYPDPLSLSRAVQKDLIEIIQSIGLYNNKSKNLIALSKVLVKDYEGEIPTDILKLVKLPGVGRKTATALLANAFDIIEGITVDTHVMRLSKRLRWIDPEEKNNAVKIEKLLIKLIPKENWKELTHLLISHGREICTAKKPNCKDCKISDCCPSKFK